MAKGVRKLKPKVKIIREVKKEDDSKKRQDASKKVVPKNESSGKESVSSEMNKPTKVIMPSSPSESVRQEDLPRPSHKDPKYDPHKGKDTFTEDNAKSYNFSIKNEMESFRKPFVAATIGTTSSFLFDKRTMQSVEKELIETSESAKNYENTTSGGSRRKEQKRYPWEV